MTVAIALQVHDGSVLASDSAWTLTDNAKTGPESILNVYDNGNKIFNIVKGLPIGGVFYGTASIGSSSISTLIKDVRKRLAGLDQNYPSWAINPDSYTIEDVAKQIREYLFVEKLSNITPYPANVSFGFYVTGYSSGADLSETWGLAINGNVCPAPVLVMGQGVANATVGGDPDPFGRLVNGYSPHLLPLLVANGFTQAEADKVIQIANTALPVNFVEAPMPIQDAIDLAEYLVETTSQFARFKRGSATVGGPTESAAITKHEGFRWVRRKHYFDVAMNPRYDR